MKKFTFLLFFFFLLSTLQILKAQSASATWPLTSSATVNATTSGDIIAAREIIGPGFSSPSYNSRALSTGGSVSAQNITVNPGGVGTSSASAHANGGYVQFTITPQDGDDFLIERISFNMGSVNANSNGTSIEYSFNSDFSSPVILGTPGGASAFPARDILYPFSFTPSGLEVKATQTFYLRIYAWNGSTTARLMILNNLVIAGSIATPKPVVKTLAVNNIMPTGATVEGTVVSDAGDPVTEPIVWTHF